MLSMCKISTMQDILQWLHREEFLEDIAKLKSGDVTTRSRDTGGTVHVKRSNPLCSLDTFLDHGINTSWMPEFRITSSI